MPIKDPEKRKAYQAEYGRKWYQAHREETIKRVAKRKRTDYGGTCKNCGGPTTGVSKGKASEYCSRPECKSAQHLANRDFFVASGRQGQKYQKELGRWSARKETASLDEILVELESKTTKELRGRNARREGEEKAAEEGQAICPDG